jgi:hypothetical protein
MLSLTRVWVCNLLVQLLLGLAIAVTLEPKIRRTCDHILLSFETPPTCRLMSRIYIPQRQRHITTDSQSVSKSWCRAQSGTFDQRFFFFKVSVLSFGGALSDERSGLSFVSLQSVYSSQSVFT